MSKNKSNCIRFEDLPLAKALVVLDDRMQSGDVACPIMTNNRPRTSIRNDSPTVEWFDWLHDQARLIWREQERVGLSQSYPWTAIQAYCFAVTIKKNPGSGMARVARVSLYRDQNTCAACGCRTGPVHTDHIKPRSTGGIDDYPNYQLVCRKHNCSKGAIRCFQSIPSTIAGQTLDSPAQAATLFP